MEICSENVAFTGSHGSTIFQKSGVLNREPQEIHLPKRKYVWII